MRLALPVGLLISAGWVGAGCAELRLPATFPEGAAGEPVVQEQALVGLDANGDAAAAQLVLAEGGEPRLSLIVLDRAGGPTRTLETALLQVARAVADRVLAAGARPVPLLGPAVAAAWPESAAMAADLGYRLSMPASPEPGRRRWAVLGAGNLPLSLRIGEEDGAPRAQVLYLGEQPGGALGGDEVELARQPLAGISVPPLLWLSGRTAWMLSGSVSGGTQPGGATGSGSAAGREPLRRALGLRRGALARGEAELHNGHGLADYGAGELDAAGREFDRALQADPRFVDALYNAASVAALSDRLEAAVALLRRAVEVDPRRVQVLGRDDDDLRVLRRRPDVRALLGLVRPSPGDDEQQRAR